MGKSIGTMDNTIKTKSETVASSDEEKQEVDQSQEDIPQAPEQQNLLEASRRRRLQVAAGSACRCSIALHQPALGRQFRGHLPVRMGDCWCHLPILSPKWRPSFNGLWRHPGLLRRQRHCHVARRDGVNVRSLPHCAKAGISQPFPVILSSAHSTAGQHTSLLRVLDSGVCYRVCTQWHQSSDGSN